MYTKSDSKPMVRHENSRNSNIVSCALHGKFITDCRDCRVAYSRNKYKEVMSSYVTCSKCNTNLRKKYIYRHSCFISFRNKEIFSESQV